MACLQEWLVYFSQYFVNVSLSAPTPAPGALPVIHTVRPFECPLCLELQHTYVHCPHCVYQWCLACEQTWRKQNDSCPYCRVFIQKAQKPPLLHENRRIPQIAYDDVYPDPIIFLMMESLHVE